MKVKILHKILHAPIKQQTTHKYANLKSRITMTQISLTNTDQTVTMNAVTSNATNNSIAKKELNNHHDPPLQNIHLNKALIMAGGFGTRMLELTKDTPKPMLILLGKPILEYSIDLCKRFGISEIAISIFHFGNKIKEYFGDGSKFGVHIVYVEEKEPLGTGGAVRLFADWLTEPFMMCNADELKDINLDEMYKRHLASGALATIALTRVDDPSQYGVVELKSDLHGDKIMRFVEKPKKEEAPSNYINAGLYIIDPQAIKYIPAGFTMVEKDLFPKLATEGKLNGFKFSGQWFDTGTPQRYADTQKSWRGFKEVPYKTSTPQ